MKTKIKEFENRFNSATDKLKALGFKGDVMIAGGLVMFGCHDKYQASFIRQAVKHVRNADELTLIENRFKNGSSVFSIILNGCFAVNKKEVRRVATNYLALAA